MRKGKFFIILSIKRIHISFLKVRIMAKYDKIEIFAAIIIGGILVGLSIFLIGCVWFIADLIMPTGKAVAILSSSNLGLTMVMIGVGILVSLFLVILFVMIYSRGYYYIREKLED